MRCIKDIKYRIYEKSKESNLPAIVLYVSTEYVSDISNILRGLHDYFQDFSDIIGSNITPRYNTRINHLIFMAQGNGDTKEILNKYGLLNLYFDKDQNYAIVKPINPIILPVRRKFIRDTPPLTRSAAKNMYHFKPFSNRIITVQICSNKHQFVIENDNETVLDLKRAIKTLNNIKNIKQIELFELSELFNHKSIDNQTKLVDIPSSIKAVI